jgi:3-phenylpropionate/cinnamic acid dioxygenase small subunit
VAAAAGPDDMASQVTRAYNLEAERLDAHDLGAWLTWVEDDFQYRVPIPVTRDDPRAPQHSATGLLATETKDSIALWVSRLSPALADSAYAENPPVRTRHFVTNVRASVSPEGVVTATSNVLLTWGKWNEPPQFVAAERRDELKDREGTLTLRRRTVLLDSNIVHLGHLRVLI